MRGAIIGDVIGSVFEHHNISYKDFPLFVPYHGHLQRPTDDSILTCAVALKFLKDAKCPEADIFTAEPVETFKDAIYLIGNMYPDAGYGKGFRSWLSSDDPEPYGSFGNGAAMRCSPAGWVAKTAEEAYTLGVETTLCTHNHEESYKAAGLVAELIFRARNGESKEALKERASRDYTVENVFEEIEKGRFHVSCQRTMPVALQAFFESTSLEDAIRTAISYGGDSDTIAAITGSIAEAYYGLDEYLWVHTTSYLQDELLRYIIEPFCRMYCGD